MKRSAQYSQRKTVCQPSPDLVDACAIDEGVSKTDVERQVVLNLPSCSNKPRDTVCLAEAFHVADFRHCPARPLVRSLEDNAGEKVCMLRARQRARDVHVGGAPAPPL